MFILFAGHCYYPFGGADDFRGFYDTIEAAQKAFIDKKQEICGDKNFDNWGQIVDKDTMDVLLIARAGYLGNYRDIMETPVWVGEETLTHERAKNFRK